MTQERKIIAHLTVGQAEAVKEAITQRFTHIMQECTKEDMIDLFAEYHDSLAALYQLGFIWTAECYRNSYEEITGVEMKVEP